MAGRLGTASGTHSWQASGPQTSILGRNASELLLAKGKEGWLFLKQSRATSAEFTLKLPQKLEPDAKLRAAEARRSTRCKRSRLPSSGESPFPLLKLQCFGLHAGKDLSHMSYSNFDLILQKHTE